MFTEHTDQPAAAVVTLPPLQLDLLPKSGGLPREIVVGRFGLHESALLKMTNIEPWKLHAWHGAQLGSPRDYKSTRRGFFYTAEGVRRVLQLCGLTGATRVVDTTPGPARRARSSHVTRAAEAHHTAS